MKITDVKIRKTFNEGNLRAIISITIDDCLAIHEIKIIKSSDKTFVAMPSRKDESGTYRDIIHPIAPGARNAIENLILKAYENYCETQNMLNHGSIVA